LTSWQASAFVPQSRRAVTKVCQVAARAFVVAAGPLANFLLAAVLLAGLYATLGKPVAPERTYSQ
jgi:regulator of sigma E protease